MNVSPIELNCALSMYNFVNSITVPAPASIAIVSNKPNPIRPIGSTVTLTCTVELSPAVDVPVTVNIHLSDPAGSPLNTTLPLVSGSSYTTTAMISSFGRNQSGIYTCTMNTSSTLTSPFITSSKTRFGTFRITAGELKVVIYNHLFSGFPFLRCVLVSEGSSVC